MISLLLAQAILAGQTQTATAGQTPPANQERKKVGALISEMFAKYDGASTLTANIECKAESGGKASIINTYMQYSRPTLYYAKQVKQGTAESAITICDGAFLGYSRPLDDTLKRLDDKYFGEQAVKVDAAGNYVQMNVADAYIAMSLSLLDRSAVMDILVARREDLQYVMNQWATLEDKGTVDYNGIKARRMGGNWRAYGDSDKILGTYEMLVSEEGADLLVYRQVENTTDIKTRKAIQSVITWTVKAVVNGEVNADLFDTKKLKN